jgi:iron complex outermembrane receptor protein
VPIKASDLEAFGRVDFAYKSGVYTNAANTTKTPDLTQVNLRAGLGNGTVSIEAFVNNLFNNKAYPSAIDFSLFTNTGNRLANNAGVAVALRELRTAGVRVKYNF